MSKGNGKKADRDSLDDGEMVSQSDRTVVVQEGGRIRIPAALYNRIGASIGGYVRIRKIGSALVIERIEN